MKIYATRHSITPLNKKRIINAQIDESLAPEGIEHAKQAVDLLPKTIKHIYTSSLRRAKQTADILNQESKLPRSAHSELMEINMGSMAGKSWDDFQSTPELKKNHYAVVYDYRPFGGESVEDVKKRIGKFFKEIKTRHNDYEALIVTHGGIIRLLHLIEHGEIRGDIEHVSFQVFDIDKILDNL